jgi:hypothetical protein
VVRQEYTYRSQLGIANDLFKNRKVKQLYLVVNDIKQQKNALTGYGNGYRYYGYSLQQEHNGLLQSLWKRIKPVTR